MCDIKNHLHSCFFVAGVQAIVAAAEGSPVVLNGALPRPGVHDHRRLCTGFEAIGSYFGEQARARRVSTARTNRRARGGHMIVGRLCETGGRGGGTGDMEFYTKSSKSKACFGAVISPSLWARLP